MPVVESALRRLEENTYNTDEGSLLWWNYYDKNIIVNTQNEYGFFATPLGQGKALDSTNFPAANQMPQAQNMEVKAFELYYIPDAPKTQAEYQHIIAALRSGWFEFKIFNSAPSVQIPLIQFMGANFPAVVSSVAAGDQVLGRSQYSGIWETPIEIILAAKANFECKITFTAPPNASMDDDQILISMVGGLVRLNS